MAPDEHGSNGDGTDPSVSQPSPDGGDGGEVIQGDFPGRSVPAAGISDVRAQWEIHTTRDKLRLHLDYWEDYWKTQIDDVRAGSRARALLSVALSILSLGLGILITYAGATQFRPVGPLSKDWVETLAKLLIVTSGVLVVTFLFLAVTTLYRRRRARRAIPSKGGEITQEALLRRIENDLDPPF